MSQTFVTATLADVFTRAFMSGVKGSPAPLDFTEALLGGAQTGTGFVAPAIAARFLKSSGLASDKVLKSTSLERYFKTAFVAAGIITAVNYPISKVAQVHKEGKATFSFSEVGNLYVNSVLGNVGFPLVFDYPNNSLPVPKCSLCKWARGSLIQVAAGWGATAAQFPAAKLRGESVNLIGAAKSSIVPAIVLNDAFQSIGKVTAFMIE